MVARRAVSAALNMPQMSAAAAWPGALSRDGDVALCAVALCRPVWVFMERLPGLRERAGLAA